MTTQPQGHTGLDRENNERPEVNQEGSEGAPEGNAAEERWQELTEGAEDPGDK